jgi:type II secretion system protein C
MVEELFAPVLTTRWGRRCALAGIVCIAGLIIFTIGNEINDWLILFNHPAAPQIFASDSADTANELTLNIKQIPNWHLFGESTTVATQTLPITSLQLRLIGVLHASDAQSSRVIISQASQPGKSYGVGDTLTGAVKIYAISQDAVILDNSGHMEKLPLARPPLLLHGLPKPLSHLDQQ